MWGRQRAGPTAPAPGDAPLLATSAHTARLAPRWNRRCRRGCCARRRVCVLCPVPVESGASTLLDHVVTWCVQHGYAVIEQRTDPGHLEDGNDPAHRAGVGVSDRGGRLRHLPME